MKTIFCVCVVLAGLASAQEDTLEEGSTEEVSCSFWDVQQKTHSSVEYGTVSLGGIFPSVEAGTDDLPFFGGAALNVSLRTLASHDIVSNCNGKVVFSYRDGGRFEIELTSNADWRVSTLSVIPIWETGTDTHVYLESAIGLSINSTFFEWIGDGNSILSLLAPLALVHGALMLGVDFDAGGQWWFVEGGMDIGGFYGMVEVRAGLKFF